MGLAYVTYIDPFSINHPWPFLGSPMPVPLVVFETGFQSFDMALSGTPAQYMSWSIKSGVYYESIGEMIPSTWQPRQTSERLLSLVNLIKFTRDST